MPNAPIAVPSTNSNAEAASSRPLVVWRFADGKPGHENQSRGLLRALGGLRPLQVVDVPVVGLRRPLLMWLSGRFPPGRGLPPPDLLVGAGHATHLPMLAARHACGGRIIVLMRPSLPLFLFDLCLVPEHDAPPPRANLRFTRGVLNNVVAGEAHDPAHGLILLGGPSRHHAWNDDAVLRQVAAVVRAEPAVHWVVANSRRTPPVLLPLVRAQEFANVEAVDWAATPPDWLPRQLARAGSVWVSEDSVSMVYEALTAGAAIGLLEVPRRGAGRVTAGLDRLVDEGLVCRFEEWRAGRSLVASASPFDEALRCAQWLDREWLDAA